MRGIDACWRPYLSGPAAVSLSGLGRKRPHHNHRSQSLFSGDMLALLLCAGNKDNAWLVRAADGGKAGWRSHLTTPC